MSRTMRWASYGGLLVAVHTPDDPGDDEWAAYLAAARAMGQSIEASLVVTAGGGPNTVQRGEMTDLFTEQGWRIKVAVVSGSRMVRGIVTALGWFNKGTRGFTTGQLREALAYLGVPHDTHGDIVDLVRELEVQLGLTGFATVA